MNIAEKSAYLKGLLEGMDYDTESREGKLFAAIIDLLGDISESIIELDDENAMITEYLEELDEDLGNVEEIVFGAEDECYCSDCCDDDEDDDYDIDDVDDDDMDEDEPSGFRAVECKHCGEDVYIDNSFTDDKIVCPHCFETIEITD